MSITQDMLGELRRAIVGRMSPHRYKHTLGVERAAVRLGSVLIPEAIPELRAAALLHDVTKELTVEEHLSLLDSAAETLNEDERAIAALLHAQSATVCIRREFAPFATERVLSAVACHTAGRADMSVFDKILFIADYIEDGRTYSSCVGVRERLYAHLDAMDVAPTLALDEALLSALDHTVTTLVGRGARICLATILARNALLDAISHA